jgi:hypothetical protein
MITPPCWTPKHTVSELAAWFTAASPVPRSEGSATLGLYPVGMCGRISAHLIANNRAELNVKAE